MAAPLRRTARPIGLAPTPPGLAAALYVLVYLPYALSETHLAQVVATTVASLLIGVASDLAIRRRR
ncbi:hypothetical protein ACC691_38645, partial [Rhizobium johnstonii]|uniref:hypothetical protein n=1 Tax=Rhizobium johnstonii TaxID=3019933 RepID=UPI003F98258F